MRKKIIFILASILFLNIFITLHPPSALAGTYTCIWTGVECVAQSQCDASQNEVAGTVCTERQSFCVPNSAVCDTCQDGEELQCQVVGEEPSPGYKCNGLACVVCDPNAPGGQDCIFNSDQYESCVSTCATGPTRWNCVENQGCVLSTTGQGQYSSQLQCQQQCGEVRVPPPGYLCKTQSGDAKPEIDSAIGCIPFPQPESIAAFLIKWGIRIAGGIAMLLFVVAGFMFITSSGDPEKIKSARDIFISAISGLLMIIFSIFLLRLIGFNILQIFT